MLTPKEKAIELVDEMYNVDFHDDHDECAMQYKHAVLCAMVAVKEMIDFEKMIVNNIKELSALNGYELKNEGLYYEEVYFELDKL